MLSWCSVPLYFHHAECDDDFLEYYVAFFCVFISEVHLKTMFLIMIFYIKYMIISKLKHIKVEVLIMHRKICFLIPLLRTKKKMVLVPDRGALSHLRFGYYLSLFRWSGSLPMIHIFAVFVIFTSSFKLVSLLFLLKQHWW